MRSDDPWRTEAVGTYLEDEDELPLGRFTRWYAIAQEHPGEFQDEGPKQFLLAVCALRPEYALALHDYHTRLRDRAESHRDHPDKPRSSDTAASVSDSERMF
ncbi:MAG: hypothetical protein OWQ56_01020 [Acidithiobacillus caldus]|nr:hypothetical protein [Acidithiobacillus caldus]